MAGDDSVLDPVARLAEEFIACYRRGERPSLSEYADRHPALADRIRQVLPMMILMEEAGQDLGGTGDVPPEAGPAGPPRVGGYRILREVGRGGMGVVYEAEQVALGRHVALKVLPVHFARRGAGPERFRREAKAAARLHHTNIVPVYEVGEDGPVCYYAMQYIHGQPLDQVIEEVRRLRAAGPGRTPPGEPTVAASAASRAATQTVALSLLSGRDPNFDCSPLPEPEGPRPATPTAAPPGPVPASLPGMADAPARSSHWHYYRSVARVGVQVAGALEHAHKEGVLHRDIKPSNLLLDGDGRVWVTDFGLAKTDGDALTHTGDVIGTVPYMAPERFRGWSDPRSDVYGLGLTLYEMVALRPAFAAADRLHLITEITRRDPPRLRRLDPQAPRDLATVIAKATDREPGRRYQTAAELAEDLRRFLEDRPIKARQTGPVERAWRWCRRNPAVALLLTVLITGSLAAAGVFRAQRDNLAEQAGQLEQETDRLVQAKKRTETALWKSKFSQARALRWSGLGGRRPEALRVLSEAAGMEPSLEPEDWRELLGRDLAPGEAARITPTLLLRNEVIACVAQTDLRVDRRWQALSRPDIEEPIDFSPDFVTCARVDDDRSICIRRVADDGIVLRLPVIGKSVCRPIRFSPRGRLLAVKQETESGVEFFLWNVTNQTTVLKPVLRGPTRHDMEAIDFSSDDRWFAVDAPDGSIVIYDLTTGKEAKRLPARRSDPQPRFARFDPSGAKLATSSEASDTVLIWDVQAERVVRKLPHPQVVAETVWSHDSRLLAVACLNGVSVWDVESGTKLADLEGHKADVWAVAFHPHAELLVSYGWDGKTRLWDFRGGRELLAVDGWFIRFSRDGRHLAFRSGRQVGLWEVTTAEECRLLYGHARKADVYSSAFDTNGRLLATCAADGVRLWDVVAGRQVAAITELGETDRVAFDPVSGGLFTCGRAGLHLWPVRIMAGGTASRYQIGPPDLIPLGTEGAPRGLSLSQDGNVLAVDLDSWQAVVIHRRERKPPIVLNAHNNQAGVVVSPDGRWVATGNYKGSGAHVWDSRTGERQQREFPCGGTAQLAFSPDNQWLVISEAGEARFYRVGTWEPRPPADWPSGIGHCLAYTRDGQVMALCTPNLGIVRLVRAGTGQELATLEITPSPSLITGPPTFSPDGSQLVIHYGHEGQRVWDLRKVRAHLAAMGLDWDMPAYPPAAESSPDPLRVAVSGRIYTREELLALSLRLLRKPLAVLGLDRSPARKAGERLGREHRENSREHLNARRWQQAFDEANKAVTLSESDAEGWLLRGRAWYELGQYRPALADFNRALALTPGNPEASHYRGHCHEYLGEHQEAVADFTAALKRIRENPHLLARRGLSYRRLGEYENAIIDLRGVLKLRPAPSDEAAARNALAWVLATGPEEMRDPAEALPLAERAVELARVSPGLARNSSDYLNTLGVVYYGLSEYKQARDTLMQAADLHNQEPTAENRFFLAMAHHRLGEAENARTCHDQAVARLKAQPWLGGHERERLAAFQAETEALLRAR